MSLDDEIDIEINENGRMTARNRRTGETAYVERTSNGLQRAAGPGYLLRAINEDGILGAAAMLKSVNRRMYNMMRRSK